MQDYLKTVLLSQAEAAPIIGRKPAFNIKTNETQLSLLQSSKS